MMRQVYSRWQLASVTREDFSDEAWSVDLPVIEPIRPKNHKRQPPRPRSLARLPKPRRKPDYGDAI